MEIKTIDSGVASLLKPFLWKLVQEMALANFGEKFAKPLELQYCSFRSNFGNRKGIRHASSTNPS